MSEHQVKALRYQVQQVGKHIKSTKKRYFWALSIGQRCYNFILDDSLVSGKSKLSINGKVFHQSDESGLNKCRYDHSFVIEGRLFNIIETEEGYEMRVDNKLFSHMLNKEMTKNSFEEHRVDESAFELAGKIRQGENKKITLSLPGMANGMKKKKTGALQSENWGEFAGSTSFPNYFGESQVKKTQENVTATQQSSLLAKVEPTSEQFSTLQSLFKTINACGEYVPKATEGTTPTYQIGEIPVIPQINLQEFTTMQQLFSTINAQPQKVEQKPAVQPKVDDFNTMQNLFSTLKFPQAQKNEAKVGVSPSVPKAEDFNTMQNLFNTLKPANQPLPSIPQDISKITIADFSTLQNLFATGVHIPASSIPAQKQAEEQEFKTVQSFSSNLQAKPQNQPDFSKINVNDFNTMQNLFTTNALGVRDVLGSTDKANKVEEPTKVEALPNQFDFNTMQNLFATNGGKTEKNENKFWQF